MKKLEEIIIDMKNNPRPAPDWDVIHQQRGEDEWSGQDYTASDNEYEEFQDNVDDFGIGSMDGKNVGDLGKRQEDFIKIGMTKFTDVRHRQAVAGQGVGHDRAVATEFTEFGHQFDVGRFTCSRDDAFAVLFDGGDGLIVVGILTGLDHVNDRVDKAVKADGGFH